MANWAIIDGLPYLIHDGMAYPSAIKQNGDYDIAADQAFPTDEQGRYLLLEIMAKCGPVSSIKRTARKSTKKGE